MRRPAETPDPVLARIKSIVRVYDSARAAIMKELTKRDVSAYKELEAIKTATRIAEIIRALNAKMTEWVGKSISSTYRESSASARVSLAVLGKRSPRGAFTREGHKAAVVDLYNQTVRDFTRANLTIKKNADAVIGAVLLGARAVARTYQAWDEFALSMASETFEQWSRTAVKEGWSRQRLSGMMHDYLLSSLEGEDFIEVNGRHFSLDYYAELVARTRLREAQTEATKNMCSEYDNDLVEFSAHNSPCALCAPFEGGVYSISGRHPVYPPLTDEETPPIHPNCEHSISPTSDIAIEVRGEFV